MLSWLRNVFTSLFAFWGALPESSKRKIVDVIVEASGKVFKAFYDEHSKAKEKANEQAEDASVEGERK
ncbi:hypothetical protein CWB85_18685 [Pseudoalteromonas sp. S1727]|uniref:hypothetical protein n=1 Tax=Pseudoalteromonas sp. S1727 TaxID=2066514 RepID=UPI00110990E4|nr:hypothetical protein [Pseudoalteromonas sp. S1727]TMN68080.1 hypothetical protein CWB85_18685 [Pseudoalteromonas sp. S1727]